MSDRQALNVLAARDEIVASPAERACRDHSFELPTAIYVAMGGLFLGFIAVLGAMSANAFMVVPLGVILAFLAAFFPMDLSYRNSMRFGMSTKPGQAPPADA